MSDILLTFGEEFILECIKKAREGNKYGDYLVDLENETSELLRLFKYIALSLLSGQLQPGGYIGLWEKEIDRMMIDYSAPPMYSKEDCRKLVARCIIEYLEGKHDPSEIWVSFEV